MKLKECLFGPTIAPCTWGQHGAIAAFVVLVAHFLSPWLAYPAAAGVSGAFIWRELRGYGKHLPWYKRLFVDLDRIMDWVTPTVVAGALAIVL